MRTLLRNILRINNSHFKIEVWILHKTNLATAIKILTNNISRKMAWRKNLLLNLQALTSLVPPRNPETKKRFSGPNPNCRLILYPNSVTVKIMEDTVVYHLCSRLKPTMKGHRSSIKFCRSKKWSENSKSP